MVYRIYLFVLLLALCAPSWCVQVRILATGDMHGAFDAQPYGSRMIGGAAALLQYWRDVEGYSPQTYLLLSTGDNAAGSPLSDKHLGIPAIDVMNVMGYDASAVGINEFAYGREAFLDMAKRASFPFLAANLLNSDGTPATEFVTGIINDEQGLKVGIIGLAYNQAYADVGYTGSAYEAAVRDVHAKLKANGALVTIVVAHAPMAEMEALATAVLDLNIPLILCGYDHIFAQKLVKYTRVVNSSAWWMGYSRIMLDYNPATKKASLISCRQVQFIHPAVMPEAEEVNAAIAFWATKGTGKDDNSVGKKK